MLYGSQDVQSKEDLRPIRAQALVRSGSGPVSTSVGSPDRTANTNQMSSSYGGRGVNFLSYFWDSDRHTPPGEKQAELGNQQQTSISPSTSKRPGYPFTTVNITPQKLPSNTAPGVRTSNPSSPHNGTFTAAITNTHAVVSDKEGKLVQSSDMTIEFTNLETFDGEKALSYNNDVSLLNPQRAAQLDVLRLNYADMLYRWGLLEQRAEILKFLSRQTSIENQSTPPEQNMQVQIRCYMCGSEVSARDRICYTCRKSRSQIRCSVCHVLVKGMVNFCSKCGHGGHSVHIKEWFSQQTVCPTGCGCICLIDG